MYIPRTLSAPISERLFKGKAIILIGARQVGKSTLFKHLLEGLNKRTLMLNCDEPEVSELLNSPSVTEMASLLADSEVVFIDEAQRVKEIGLTLKRMIENFPDKQILVSGSSAFELHNRLNEPLTGRKYEFFLYPISTKEILGLPSGLLNLKQSFEFRLIYGSYPEIINSPKEAQELLLLLSESYLYKDILMLEDVRRSSLLVSILKALALQVGSEVSFNELASLVGSNPKTVEKYIDLLEKCFVIFRLPALSRNMRNELKKARKIFFWDNGVRNAIIQNFAPLELRSDKGALWENFFISERIKYNNNRQYKAAYYFWRTTDRQEIDLIEEHEGVFHIFEMKYNSQRKTSFPASFLGNYPVAEEAVVTPGNYTSFLS